jgi:hypothetical protein
MFPPSRQVGLQPRFTLVMVYVFAFCFAFSLALAVPDLLRALRELPAEAGNDAEIARRVAQDALRGRLPWAFAAAVAATALGATSGRLPGLRR